MCVTDSHIGFLGAISPAITFLVSPLWGALADETGWHKRIMLLTFIGSIVFRTLLVYGHSMNFLVLSIVVALAATLNAPVKPLMDSAVMSMLKDKADYGRSRLFGQFGFGFGSFLSGQLAAYLSSGYKSVFIIQNFFSIPTTLLMLSFKPKKSAVKLIVPEKSASVRSPTHALKNNDPSPTSPKAVEKKADKVHVIQALKVVLKDVNILIFFTVVFLIGISSGIVGKIHIRICVYIVYVYVNI